MRKVMTRVLPVPAPARINSGPWRVSTARRCWGFNEPRFNMRARSVERARVDATSLNSIPQKELNNPFSSQIPHHRSGFLRFQPLQILRYELGDFLELGNVGRIDIH